MKPRFWSAALLGAALVISVAMAPTTLRADDNPDVLAQRLKAYREQTSPLVAYYAGKGALRSVDGMASIPAVTAAINGLLNGSKEKAKTRRPRRKDGSVRDGADQPGAGRRSATAKIARKTANLGALTRDKAGN